jgi:hypothetical protein
MRRLLLLSAGLAALSCAHHPKTGGAESKASKEAAEAVAGLEELAPQKGEHATAYDLDRDGKADLWRYTVLVEDGKERVVRKERDLNGDGRVDMWEAYDQDGNLIKQAFDLDFDGKPDLAITYEKGQLVKKEFAPGFDGMVRTTEYYEEGKLVRKERDTKGDGKIDTWEYFENGELDRIGVDLDGDGQVDRWTRRGGDQDTAAGTAPAAGAAPGTAPAATPASN